MLSDVDNPQGQTVNPFAGWLAAGSLDATRDVLRGANSDIVNRRVAPALPAGETAARVAGIELARPVGLTAGRHAAQPASR